MERDPLIPQDFDFLWTRRERPHPLIKCHEHRLMGLGNLKKVRIHYLVWAERVRKCLPLRIQRRWLRLEISVQRIVDNFREQICRFRRASPARQRRGSMTAG